MILSLEKKIERELIIGLLSWRLITVIARQELGLHTRQFVQSMDFY